MNLRKIGLIALGIAAMVLLIASIASLSDSNAGIVRMIDFLREPILYLSIILAVIAVFLRSRAGYAVSGVLLVVALIQLVRLWPFLPLAEEQVALNDDDDNGVCFTALSLNVKQSNDAYDRVADLIEREDPDLLLLMETNGAWMDALDEQIAAYPQQMAMPLGKQIRNGVRQPHPGAESQDDYQYIVRHAHALRNITLG